MVRYSFLVRLSHPLLHAGLSRRILDHLIRSRQHVRRNRQTDLLRGFEIDDQLKLRRLLYREISRLSAFENLVHVGGGTVSQVGKAHAVAHKPPVRFDISRIIVYRRETALHSEICNLWPARTVDGALNLPKDCVSLPPNGGSKCGLNILGT